MSFQNFRQDFQHKNILIFGLGILGGGKGVVEVFQQLDCIIRITDKKTAEQLLSITDTLSKKNIDQLVFGEHRKEDIEWADVIIKNPAVPNTSEFMTYAKQLGKHITTEVALFLKYTSSTTIGITGTRGKTTTTMATHYILEKEYGTRVVIGGDLRDNASLPLLIDESTETISVLELSSFALEACHTEQVSPHIAAVTNLYTDHMDRYENQEEYAHAKAAIVAYQNENDFTFLNESDAWTSYFTSQSKGTVHLVHPHIELDSTDTVLKGNHNVVNLSFAVAIAIQMGVLKERAIKFAQQFQGAPFRQQVVGRNATTTFVNDSTSTTPEAVMVALEAFPTAHFIIGGTTKHLDQTKLAEKLKHFGGKVFYLKGSGTSELLEKIENNVTVFDSLQDAFTASLQDHPTHVVFSPGFTSFELFKNEFDRADQFNELVSQVVS